MKIVDYDRNSYGNSSNDSLINNSHIYDNLLDRNLKQCEIEKLNLFINPLSAEVFRYFENENEFKKDNRYSYESY